ncbi:hypothetical protein MnTg04_01550 [bacterium MnTg04]|nr:hypothetical protein MnTg04_01550 [bacterium MnTg04]
MLSGKPLLAVSIAGCTSVCQGSLPNCSLARPQAAIAPGVPIEALPTRVVTPPPYSMCTESRSGAGGMPSRPGISTLPSMVTGGPSCGQIVR